VSRGGAVEARFGPTRLGTTRQHWSGGARPGPVIKVSHGLAVEVWLGAH